MHTQEINVTNGLSDAGKQAYQAPAVKVLGSLASLTQSGSKNGSESGGNVMGNNSNINVMA